MAADLNKVKADQPSSMTTMTVVICITQRAFSLDSSMPLMFSHQKYMRDGDGEDDGGAVDADLRGAMKEVVHGGGNPAMSVGDA